MEIIFLGGLFPKHLELEIIQNSKRGVNFAANSLQWGLVDGLEILNKGSLHLCNLMYIGAFPQGYKKIFIRTENFSHRPGSDDTNYGFLNLIGLRIFSRFLVGTRGLFKWARKTSDKRIILNYSIHTPLLFASFITKLIFPRIKLCLVVTDLPELMSDSKNVVYRILKTVDKCIINLCLTKVDAFILLSKFMKEKLKIGKKPWVLVEGIFNRKGYAFTEGKDQNKIIMYSGRLDKNQGILDLLASFSMIKNDNYRLWITGSGEGLSEILKASQIDSRINYWSNLKKIDLFNLLQKATLLINPLRSDHRKTKYFFPSKTMEYMASGTPTLMYDLPCIPEEYYNYMYYFTNDTLKGMRDKIVEICEKPESELIDFGKKAQEFILKSKNPEAQCKKIYSMMLSLFDL
jgi:glycosyltransferase involved in cell wall biosynthesis